MYMGGLIKEVIFQEVINNSETQGDGNTQVLGWKRDGLSRSRYCCYVVLSMLCVMGVLSE